MLSVFAVVCSCVCALVLPASAANATQDHLDVVFTTDQSSYGETDDITVYLQVTNTGKETVGNISLQNLIPDGYQLVDDSSGSLSALSLDPGENISLTTVMAASDKDEGQDDGSSEGDDQEGPANPGDNPGEKPSEGDSQGEQPGDTDAGPQNGNDTTPTDGSGSGDVQNPENSLGENNNIHESVSGTNSPETGDFSRAMLCLIIVGISAGVIILVIRKHKKVVSVMLSIAVVGSSVAGLSLSAQAAGPERKSIEISTDVTILKSSGTEDLTLQGLVEYDAPASEEETASLKNFESDEIYFLAGMESEITFSVEADGEFDSVNLCDENGEVIHAMLDDGTSGDETAGDGIYTYKWNTVFDEEQFTDYHAEAGGANSNEITIYFFDEFTEEDNVFLQNIEDEFAKIEAPYENEQGFVPADDVDEILEKAGSYGNELLENGDAIICEVTDSSVVLKLTSGIRYIYTPSVKDTYNNGTEDPVIKFYAYQPVYSWVATLTSVIPLPDGCFDLADIPKATAEQLDNNLYNISYSQENLKLNSEVTPESLHSFGPNQIIVWQGHGMDGGSEVHSVLATARDYNPDKEAYDFAYIKDLIVDAGGKEGITAKYVDDYCGNMDHTYVFIGSCYSACDKVLAQSFINKGADAVVAFDKRVDCAYSDMMQYKTTTLLSQINPDTGNYYKLGEALNTAKELYGENDSKYPEAMGASPILFGNENESAKNYNLASEYFSGYIKEASNPEVAINDVHIEISGENGIFEAYTDADGKFMCCLPEGHYQVIYQKVGYFDLETEITVNNDEPYILKDPVLLEHIPVISGTVTDEKGQALTGVTIDIFNSATGESVANLQTTDLSGAFSVTLNKGTYDIIFSKDGYRTVTKKGIAAEDGYYQLETIIMETDTAAASEIWTEEDFTAMDGQSGSYILMQDLDLTDSPRIEFNGTFDGNGHTISIPFSEENGMFSTLGEQAVVENCIIDYGSYSSEYPSANDTNNNSSYDFGGIALDNSGVISKCEANGNIILSEYYSGKNVMIGTFCVANNGEISYCRSNVNYTIVGHQSAWWYVISGIGGDPWSQGNIEKCLNTGDINATIYNENDYNLLQDILIAGIGTYNMSNCANTGDIKLNYQSILLDTADAHTGVGFISPYELYTTGYELVSDGFPEKLKGQGGSYISKDCILDYTNSTADYDSIRIFETKTYTAEETENITVISEDAIMEWWDSINN